MAHPLPDGEELTAAAGGPRVGGLTASFRTLLCLPLAGTALATTGAGADG